MKKHFMYTLFTAVAFAAALVSVGCDDNDNTETTADAPAITVNNENSVSVSFDTNGGYKSFSVYANADWNISFSNQSASEWVTVSKSEGAKGTTEINITVAQNGDEEKREATLEFIAANENGSALASVVVSQAGTEQGIEIDEDYMTVTPFNISVSSAAGSFDITIESNVEWTVSSSDEENFALNTISGSNNGTVTVTYTANESTTDSRDIVIMVEPSIGSVDTAIIPVTQSKSSDAGGGEGSEASMTITIDTMVEGQTSDFALVQTTYDNQAFETPYTWSQIGFDFAGYKVCIPNGRDEFVGSVQGQGNDSDDTKQMLIYNTSAINDIRKVVVTFSDSRLALGDGYDPKEFSFYAGGGYRYNGKPRSGGRNKIHGRI